MTTTPTTVELSPDLYARAVATAKKRGLSVNDFVAESVTNHSEPDPEVRARIIKAAIELSALHEENLRIMERIEETFDPEMLVEQIAQEAVA